MTQKNLTAVAFAILATIILIAIATSGYGFDYIPEEHLGNPSVVLPVLLLVGTVGLLVSLTFVAAIFAALDLSDEKRALGLPEGSVRALIALLLLTFFAITTIFLYRQLRAPETYISTGLTEAAKDQLLEILPGTDILSVEGRTVEGQMIYDIKRQANSEAGVNFAQQMLTMLGTLVAAISAFYFGTKVNEGERTPQVETPSVTKVPQPTEPTPAPASPQPQLT